MKKYIYTFALAAGLGLFSSCSESEYEIDNLIPDEYNKVLYILDSGEKDLTLELDGDKKVSYTYSVVKAGADPTATAEVNLRVMTQDEIDQKWTNLTGRIHKLLPENTYSLDVNNLVYTADDAFKEFNIELDPQAINEYILQQKALVSSDDAKYMKFVLPLLAEGATPSDSINSAKNYVMLNISRVTFPAPSTVYLISDDMDESFESLEMSASGNTFTGVAMFKDNAEISFREQENSGDNYFIMDGEIKIGEGSYAVDAGLNKITLDFDKGTISVQKFGQIDYVKPFICTYNREWELTMNYVGGGVFSGVGLTEFKHEGWSWDNYADTRYKFREHRKDGTVIEWGRMNSPEMASSDNDWTLDNPYYFMTQTDGSQWGGGQWKMHPNFHNPNKTQNGSVGVKVKMSVYYNGSTPTHRIEYAD